MLRTTLGECGEGVQREGIVLLFAGEGENMAEGAPQINQDGTFGFGAPQAQTQQNFNFANGGDSMDM